MLQATLQDWNLWRIDWSNACPVKLINFHASCSGTSSPQCNTICIGQNIVSKATEKNQVALAKTFPLTLELCFSKMHKIFSRNVSPPPGVRWYASLHNTQRASHVITTHRKTLRATQSANLNLEMTEILCQLKENNVWNFWLKIKIPVDLKPKKLPSINFLSNELLPGNAIFKGHQLQKWPLT